MKPFIVLLLTFGCSLLIFIVLGKNIDFAKSGRIAMSVMLLFTSLAHFKFQKGMEMMLPNFVPFKSEIVVGTGIIEILASVGLLIPSLQVATGWMLILFFLMILPANIFAVFHKINYQNGTFDGNGVSYLWFRVPLQILFILWVYFSAIKI